MLDKLGNILGTLLRLFKWWIVIEPWEQALRVRLGKHITLLGPGIHWAIPYVHQTYTQTVRTRVHGLPLQSLTTLDAKTIAISGTLSYCITDIRKLYDTLYQASDSVRTIAENAIAQYITTHPLADCTPLDITHSVTKSLDLSRNGIGCVSVMISDYMLVPKTLRLVIDKREAIYDSLHTDNAQGM